MLQPWTLGRGRSGSVGGSGGFGSGKAGVSSSGGREGLRAGRRVGTGGMVSL